MDQFVEQSVEHRGPGNPAWRPGVSANPSGKPKGPSFAERCKARIDAFAAELGGRPSAIDRTLIEQAALMATRAEDLQRRRAIGRRIKDEDLSRYTNGCARILLRLRDGGRRHEPREETLAEYARRTHGGA